MAGVDTGITLSAKQCIEIGRQAITEERYYQAVSWMETALARTRFHTDTTASLNEAEIEFERAKQVVSLTCQSISSSKSRAGGRVLNL